MCTGRLRGSFRQEGSCQQWVKAISRPVKGISGQELNFCKEQNAGDDRLVSRTADCGMKHFMECLHRWRMTDMVPRSVASS